MITLSGFHCTNKRKKALKCFNYHALFAKCTGEHGKSTLTNIKKWLKQWQNSSDNTHPFYLPKKQLQCTYNFMHDYFY